MLYYYAVYYAILLCYTTMLYITLYYYAVYYAILLCCILHYTTMLYTMLYYYAVYYTIHNVVRHLSERDEARVVGPDVLLVHLVRHQTHLDSICTGYHYIVEGDTMNITHNCA